MDSKYIWTELLEKYVNKEISKEELAELYRQMNCSIIKRKQFDKVTTPGYFNKAMREFLHADPDDDLIKSIEKSPSTISSLRTWLFLNKNIQYRAAAFVVILIVAISIYFFVLKHPQTDITTTDLAISVKPAIKPYSYFQYAGMELKLNEAANDSLLKSKGFQIRKIDSVFEIYKTSNKQLKDTSTLYMVTAPKQQEGIRLPDGSTCTLDAASFIGFNPLELDKQRIIRIYGQAYCRITRITNNEFIVQLNDNIEVIATGTEFSVRNYRNENPKITLVAGTVRLKRGKQTFLMKSGQTVELTKEKIFKLVETSLSKYETAWTAREFAFEHENIYDLMHQVGAFYNYPVQFNGKMSNITAGGRFPIYNDWENIKSSIEQLYSVSINVKNDTLFVTPGHYP